MRLFYYVHTGHRIGLDRFRRAATIIRAMGDTDITLLTSDFRIGAEAREHGVKRAVCVDVVRNIPQIAHHGDKIIFDSAESNPTQIEEMTRFFSSFIRVSDDPEDVKHENELLISPYMEGEGICNAVVVDDEYFGEFEKTMGTVFFFGDDDYEEDIFNHLAMFEGLNMDILTGFYYFFDYEEKIAPAFNKQYNPDEYDDVIKHAKVLVTSSPQAALESLAAGGKPIYLQRPDYPRDHLNYIRKCNIPVIDGFNREVLSELLTTVDSQSYHTIPKSSKSTVEFIRKSFDL